MLFNSFQFLIFFIVVTSFYFLLPYNKRWFLLLLASCYFYMVFVPIYILILGFTIVIDYLLCFIRSLWPALLKDLKIYYTSLGKNMISIMTELLKVLN